MKILVLIGLLYYDTTMPHFTPLHLQNCLSRQNAANEARASAPIVDHAQQHFSPFCSGIRQLPYEWLQSCMTCQAELYYSGVTLWLCVAKGIRVGSPLSVRSVMDAQGGKKTKTKHIIHMCAWLYNRFMGWDACVQQPLIFPFVTGCWVYSSDTNSWGQTGAHCSPPSHAWVSPDNPGKQ